MTTLPTRLYMIGYLDSSMEEGIGRSLWLSIKDTARGLGARLVTFAGAELRYSEPFYHHANQVCGLVDCQQLDGLIIWSSSLAGFIGRGNEEFCQPYSPLPDEYQFIASDERLESLLVRVCCESFESSCLCNNR